ncbi:MAG TPA: prolipoprotein diacylglyceryl transferase [Oscillospiraceae bacterium]|nr:prolipoprotein diacylglyceryl transferase [Oscillospiraceae bacterium]HPF55067.1 prolipoprotein diacylglyceryl transferase [Clostridiales bacterium]HPK34884.1 prolipoprotein diacylglyceryl transferase [Oscillospiraceae bacterium]HPR76152.1 prolipoprotein diacylglyceryl transferase [Oscillospiraceae bacterium]
MYPEINLFGLHIQTYGVMVLIGFITAYFTVKIRAKNAGIKLDVFYLSVWALVGGFVVAKVLYWITVAGRMATAIGNIGGTITFGEFFKDYILSGFVFYGGLIGGALAVAWYLHDERQKLSDFVNIVIPAIPLGQAFGRIGCFFAGCCYGDVCITADTIFPVQLVESACNFLIFGILLLVLNQKRKKPVTRPIGLALYLLMYSVVRFILEFFREDTIRGSVGALSTSQFIGIFLFVLGLLLLIFEKQIYGFIDKLVMLPTKKMKKEAAAAGTSEETADAEKQTENAEDEPKTEEEKTEDHKDENK